MKTVSETNIKEIAEYAAKKYGKNAVHMFSTPESMGRLLKEYQKDFENFCDKYMKLKGSYMVYQYKKAEAIEGAFAGQLFLNINADFIHEKNMEILNKH